MRVFFFILFGCATQAIFGLLVILLLKYANREWYSLRLVRRASRILPALGIVSFLVFVAGLGLHIGWSFQVAGIFTSLIFVLQVSLMLSLIPSGLVHLGNILWDRLAGCDEETTSKFDISRRRILKTTAVGFPAIAVGMTSYGFGRSFMHAHVYVRRIEMPHLPVEFSGMRILHLSDLHLAEWVTLQDLESVLEDAAAFSPEMIAVTGDIADNLKLLPTAIEMLEEFAPPLGTFAVYGNHEYFRGPEEVREMFDRSTIPLLVNDRLRLTRDGRSVLVGGIDDPRQMHGATPSFYRNCLRTTIPEGNDADLSVLLSHRPGVFEHAATSGADLILAGHTHGGQIGLGGRSVFEGMAPQGYLWGHYTRESSHLYTSSGMGHWFPFRLGCPPEAPVIELVTG